MTCTNPWLNYVLADNKVDKNYNRYGQTRFFYGIM